MIKKKAKETGFEIVKRLYDGGERNFDVLAQEAHISKVTIRSYVSKIKKQEREKNKESSGEEEKYIQFKKHIINELKNKYPIQVAQDNNISISSVYEIIEKMSEKEKQEVITANLKSNPIRNKIIYNSFIKYLDTVDGIQDFYNSEDMRDEDIIYLLKMCYTIKQYSGRVKKINHLFFKLLKESSKNIEINEKLEEEKLLIVNELKVQAIRKIFEKEWYSKGLIDFCKKIKVTPEFLKSSTGITFDPVFTPQDSIKLSKRTFKEDDKVDIKSFPEEK